MTIKIRRSLPHDVQLSRRLSSVYTEMGIAPVEALHEELLRYTAVLKGEEECPIDSPYLALQEVATAYYVRAQEIDMRIHAAEREGVVVKNSPYYRFRTGELRSFLELAKAAAQLGSRRLEQEKFLFAQREVT